MSSSFVRERNATDPDPAPLSTTADISTPQPVHRPLAQSQSNRESTTQTKRSERVVPVSILRELRIQPSPFRAGPDTRHCIRSQLTGTEASLSSESSTLSRVSASKRFGLFLLSPQCAPTTDGLLLVRTQAMNHSDNMVVSSPTGSGKTVVFELSIIRMLEASEYGKAVYLAPTKALCGERFKDWSARFAGIGIKCMSFPLSPSCQDLNPNFFLAGVEITSDTPWGGQWFKQLADARIIITTPEKYDSITRWFVRPLALFLIGVS